MMTHVEDNSDPYQTEQTSRAFLGKAAKYRSMLESARAAEAARAKDGDDKAGDTTAEDDFKDISLI